MLTKRFEIKIQKMSVKKLKQNKTALRPPRSRYNTNHFFMRKTFADISLSISCFPFHCCSMLDSIYQLSSQWAANSFIQLRRALHSHQCTILSLSFFIFHFVLHVFPPRYVRCESLSVYMSVFTTIFFNSFSNLLWVELHGFSAHSRRTKEIT